jgi:hypothetical protein
MDFSRASVNVKIDAQEDERPQHDGESSRHDALEARHVRKVSVGVGNHETDHEVDEGRQ